MNFEPVLFYFSRFLKPVHRNENKPTLLFPSIKKVIYLIILFNGTTFTQNFFPTELNNRYQLYQEAFGQTAHIGPWWYDQYLSFKIITDTIIEGKRFVNFVGYPFNAVNFYHYDTLTQKVFIKIPGDDTIRIAADFNLAVGDSLLSYINGEPGIYISKGLSNLYIFGDSILCYRMEYEYWTTISVTTYKYTFARDVGLVRFYKHIGTTIGYATYVNNVVSAIVDTTYFDPIYLNITLVTPLDNRPVNAFPFTLNCSYTTNLNMVNSFYVKAILMRGQDTIDIFSEYFVNNRVEILLSPQVGDKVLIKAFISDNSIFGNTDTYPDSGYAEILVLPSTVNVDDNDPPHLFTLGQNYPNPFNPETKIRYQVPAYSLVTLFIYDVMGNEISRPVNEEKQPGVYTYEFDGSALSSGVYFYRLTAGGKTDIKKMLLMK